jgi:large subunit ribosomal protein LP2
MRYIAAYLLAVLGGHTTPNEHDLVRILHSCGVETNEERSNAVIKAMEGKSVEQVIAAGQGKLASFGSAGGAAPAAGAAAAGGEAAKEEEKAVEEEEEIDMGGGMDMFGGGDEDY